MAYASTQSTFNFKENRSRPHNTSYVPSRRHPTREAGRRTSYSTPVARPHGFDVDIEDEPSTSHAATAHSPKTSLPRHLRRPAFRAISPAAISAIDPDLRDVPIEFIHRKIRGVSDHMFAIAAKTVASCPKGRLPRELQVVVHDISAYTPTHLFAVYATPSALHKQRLALHPSHALILAANCANLPPLPYSRPAPSSFPGSVVTLPVVPLCIPSPDTFPILLDYLYTRRGSRLLGSLLPLSPRAEIQSPVQLSRELAEMVMVPTLRTHLHQVHGLWSNVTALGVFDEDLWRSIELAWDVLHKALASSSGSR